jgi:TorA maturation chaperone TorD
LFSYPEHWPEEGDLQVLTDEDQSRWAVDPTENDLQKLQSHYVRLFVNALPEVPCPPFGSCYLEGSLLGESTQWVDQLYRRYGLETDEIPDHIAVELEFLAFLADRRTSASLEDFDALLSHLRSWMPEFLDRIHQYDQSGFYRAVSEVAATKLLPPTVRLPDSRSGSGHPVEWQQRG